MQLINGNLVNEVMDANNFVLDIESNFERKNACHLLITMHKDFLVYATNFYSGKIVWDRVPFNIYRE